MWEHCKGLQIDRIDTHASRPRKTKWNPCHPIIYVRGYAMTNGEKDETPTDPFCGLDLGSTI